MISDPSQAGAIRSFKGSYMSRGCQAYWLLTCDISAEPVSLGNDAGDMLASFLTRHPSLTARVRVNNVCHFNPDDWIRPPSILNARSPTQSSRIAGSPTPMKPPRHFKHRDEADSRCTEFAGPSHRSVSLLSRILRFLLHFAHDGSIDTPATRHGSSSSMHDLRQGDGRCFTRLRHLAFEVQGHHLKKHDGIWDAVDVWGRKCLTLEACCLSTFIIQFTTLGLTLLRWVGDEEAHRGDIGTLLQNNLITQ
ncbi:hypothetical protein FB451DRAFT_1513808 [Mycena latifolia]|nr:hypothetical protein FB451DRAFT_1513808 [Mycena latifolia]